MKRLRIAYVINSVEGGGAAQPVPAITKVLRDQGAEVRVFVLTPRDRLGLPAMVEAGLQPMVRDGGTSDHLAAMRWLRRQLTDWGATHIWTSLSRATILGLTIGPMLRLPVISWQHNAFLKPWNERLLRLLESRAMLWIGDSESVTALTAERLGVPARRLACWPIYAADPAMPRAPEWQPGQVLSIGSLGRLHPAKGYDVLIAALARLHADGFTQACPFAISIAGEGAERARLESLAQNAGLQNVSFPGFTANPATFLAQLHLYLQPSRTEGFCIAAHEAMTAGVPVVASAVGELPWSIAQGQTGFTVPPDDPAALAHALRDILAEPQKLAAMGKAAREVMLDRFSQQKFAERGIAIFNRICSVTTPGRA